MDLAEIARLVARNEMDCRSGTASEGDGLVVVRTLLTVACRFVVADLASPKPSTIVEHWLYEINSGNLNSGFSTRECEIPPIIGRLLSPCTVTCCRSNSIATPLRLVT